MRQTYKLTCTITSGSFVTPAKPSVGFSNSGVVFRVLEADVNTAGDTLSIWVVGLLDGLMPMDGSVTVSTEVDNSGVSTATGSCAISSIAVPVFPEA